MILSHEAQLTLVLLAKRKQKDPSCEYWGRSDINTGVWTCLACNMKFSKDEMIQHDETPKTHLHGLECLKKYNLLALI